MNCEYKIKIVGDLFFRGKLLTICYQNDINDIMNQFDYIKKANIVTRTFILNKSSYIFLECLCNQELRLEELREFVEKIKRDGFRSQSSYTIVSFIETKTIPNRYIHQIDFNTGELVFPIKPTSKRESNYSSRVIYQAKAKAKYEDEPGAGAEIMKCGSGYFLFIKGLNKYYRKNHAC